MSTLISNGTYTGSNTYDRFNHYYATTFNDSKLKKVKKRKPIPKKKEVHIFDIKDLDLKEV